MGAMPTRGLSAWDTLRSYLPNSHDLFKVAVAILILLAFYLLARLVRLLASKELRRVKADPQVTLLVNRFVFLTALVIGIIAAFSELFGSPALVFGGFGFLALALSLAFQDILKNFIAGLSTMPVWLSTVISSPSRNGRSTNMKRPAMKFFRISWKARLKARARNPKPPKTSAGLPKSSLKAAMMPITSAVRNTIRLTSSATCGSALTRRSSLLARSRTRRASR